MKVVTADFVKSCTRYSEGPTDGLPEFAFIGRSNVGKSSLINMLCNRKSLARTSRTPGKTQTINFYFINKDWYLVDLPGYGYAKVSRSQRETWSPMIGDYILKRKSLACLFVLIDSRLGPQTVDLDFVHWLGENRIPFALAFTKTDKLSHNNVKKNISSFKESLRQEWETLPLSFETSATAKVGRAEMLNYISGLFDN